MDGEDGGSAEENIRKRRRRPGGLQPEEQGDGSLSDRRTSGNYTTEQLLSRIEALEKQKKEEEQLRLEAERRVLDVELETRQQLSEAEERAAEAERQLEARFVITWCSRLIMRQVP